MWMDVDAHVGVAVAANKNGTRAFFFVIKLFSI